MELEREMRKAAGRAIFMKLAGQTRNMKLGEIRRDGINFVWRVSEKATQKKAVGQALIKAQDCEFR